MQKLRLQKWITALFTAVICIVLLATMASAMGAYAPALQQLRAKEVKGSVGAGQSIWLGLTPETSGATVTILAEFDRNNPADNGVNFYLLDDSGLRRIGDGPLSSIALGAGSANFVLNGPGNVVGASFNAVGLAQYTIVLLNESGAVANFTLKATNGFILDDSKQVTDANAAPVSTAVTSTTSSTTATTTTNTAAPTAQPTQAPTPAPVATTVATTATGATTTTTATPATSAAPGQPVVVRATAVSGDLPKQNDQHYIGLEPTARDGQITLRLTIDPQDSSELQRRLNFWVVDETGFKQVTGGADPSDVAIAAGNRAFRSESNERVASFKAVGTGNYTVIVYNNAAIPGSYALSVEGGQLVDDSNQTKEAAKLALSTTTVSATTTSTTTATTTTTAAPAAVGATTAVTPTARTAQPGGTYTIKSGDTLALLARDVYGDYRLYEQICAFNSRSNCDLVEVGDVIKLPTRAQIQAGITAPAPKPTQAAPKPAAAATVTTTVPATTTAGSTKPVTSTTGVTSTTTATSTTGTGVQTNAPANRNIYQTLAANTNFKSLTKALETTGLDALLAGPGPYTIFAPTEAAFTALRTQFKLTDAQLLALPELADTLKYHVLDGKTMAEDISNNLQATTAQGKAVRFEVNGSTVKINGATLVATDIETANGVIHAIDAVIIPPAD